MVIPPFLIELMGGITRVSQSQTRFYYSFVPYGLCGHTYPPHGFRHIASTLFNTRGFDERHIEAELAHVKDGVAGVYNKAQYLDDRKIMLQWYANHLEEIADQSFIQLIRQIDKTCRTKSP